MNEDERGITPRDVTAITVSLISEGADVFGRRWGVTIEQGNGDVLKMFELTEMERIQLGLVLSSADVGEMPVEHCGFVDFSRRAPAGGSVREMLAREAEEAEARAEAEERTP